jgi:hypothetical protein
MSDVAATVGHQVSMSGMGGGGRWAVTWVSQPSQHGYASLRTARRVRTAEQVAVEAREDLTLALNGALAPITNYLGGMATAPTEEVRATIAGVRGALDASASGVRRRDARR